MSLVLACDPGLRAVGAALYDSGCLVRATLVRSPERILRGPGAWEAMAQAVREEFPWDLDALVVEVPQYDARTPAAVVDVFEVFGVAINLVGALSFDAAFLPTVRQWKGSMGKGVTTERLFKELSLDEFENIETDDHNAIDAASLAFWHVTGGSWRRVDFVP